MLGYTIFYVRGALVEHVVFVVGFGGNAGSLYLAVRKLTIELEILALQ